MALLFHIQRPPLSPYSLKLQRFIRRAARYPVVANCRLLYRQIPQPTSRSEPDWKSRTCPGKLGHWFKHRRLRDFSRKRYMRSKGHRVGGQPQAADFSAQRALKLEQSRGGSLATATTISDFCQCSQVSKQTLNSGQRTAAPIARNATASSLDTSPANATVMMVVCQRGTSRASLGKPTARAIDSIRRRISGVGNAAKNNLTRIRANQRRSSRASAQRTVLRRTASRSPRKCLRSTPNAGACHASSAQQNHTVPTGFPGPPPSGPAMPVTATAYEAPVRLIAPRAMARATASLTAPCAHKSERVTPSVAPWLRCYT